MNEECDARIDEGPVLGSVALTRIGDPRDVGATSQEQVITARVLHGVCEEGVVAVVNV